MKKLFAGTQHTKFIAAASAFIWTIAIATSARAVQLHAARITQVTNDVKVLLEKAPPRPVALSDVIRHGTAVRTGTQSRTEVTFDDLTITRLVANTTFSFKEGTREMNLIDGAILFQVPKGSGGATIRTAGVTAVITGTTGIGEFHPATSSNPHLFSKWLCLEGTFRLYLPNGQSVEVSPGKMVTTDGNNFSIVLTFDIAKLVSTSLFFTGFDRRLPSLDLIVQEEQKQLASMLLIAPTPYPLDPIRIYDVIDRDANSNPAVIKVRFGTPTPTPSKFGTPKVITSPVPYLITSGTAITTDPSITTNGVTDFGKIYRGPGDDGAFSLWAFGSTSAVDTALDFDTHFNNSGHFPAAAFKFTSLVLAGNPTIDLTNGGVTNLALISVGDITSGLPGGTLTFTGLAALLLASQDGSINLGSEITFQGIPTLFFYARGTNGDLTLASPVIGTTDLFLYAGRNITFNAGTDNLILGGQFSIRSAGGNISVSGNIDNIAIGGSLAATSDVIADAANGGNITFSPSVGFSASDVVVETTVKPGVTLTHGANITFDIGFEIGTGLTVNGGSLSLTINDSNGGTIGTGGNIEVDTIGNLTVDGGGALTLYVLNNDGGHIGTGGSIFVGAGGDLTAGSIDALIDNRNGGTIDSSANLTFNIAGARTTTGDASFVITNRNGGHILGNAFNHVSAAGDLTAQGALDFAIQNAGSLLNNGGTIDMDATINVSATNISATTDYFQALIWNAGGGHIGGNAVLDISASNGLTSGGDAFFSILNSPNGQDTHAGTIGGNATIQANVGSMSVGGFLDAVIDNSNGGSIGGNAIVNFDLSGAIDTHGDAAHGDADFQIFNGTDGSSAGTIGSDATINVTAASISPGGAFDAEIDNHGGGNIGGNANINFNLTGDLTTQGDALLTISNETGGTIGSNTAISVTASNIFTGGNLGVTIENRNGGVIDSSATLSFNIAGNLTTQGAAAFLILSGSEGQSMIGSNATVNVTANNISTGDALSAIIINFFDATIGGDAAVNLIAASVSTVGALNVTIDNTRSGTIGSDAAVTLSANNISSGGAFDAEIANYLGGNIGGNTTVNVTAANITANSLSAGIDNSNGGSIGGNAAINMNVSGTATITNDATLQILGSDGAAAAAINFNGGSYNVGGTFLSYIDGNGTITFNNASAHADVLKAGVFGANGVLNVGGGILSADSELKLYAPGSNGQLNFVSNVTLGGNSLKILAANSVAIFNNIVVTIGGPNPADVYTNNANYTGFGGNDTTTGTFAGAGANNPQPLSSAPPFGTPPPGRVTTGGNITHGAANRGTINVNNTAELLALLDGAAVGRDGKITISGSTTKSNLRNLSRINMNGLPRRVRAMLIHEMRDRSTMQTGGRRTL